MSCLYKGGKCSGFIYFIPVFSCIPRQYPQTGINSQILRLKIFLKQTPYKFPFSVFFHIADRKG